MLSDAKNLFFSELLDLRFVNSLGNRVDCSVERKQINNREGYIIAFTIYPGEGVFFDFRSSSDNGFEFGVSLDYKVCFTEEHVGRLLGK